MDIKNILKENEKHRKEIEELEEKIEKLKEEKMKGLGEFIACILPDLEDDEYNNHEFQDAEDEVSASDLADFVKMKVFEMHDTVEDRLDAMADVIGFLNVWRDSLSRKCWREEQAKRDECRCEKNERAF